MDVIHRVIEDSWQDNSDLLNNLENCRFGMVNWSRQSFGQVKERVRKFKKILEELRGQPMTPANQKLTQEIKLLLEEELDREELMWNQQAKTQWLAEGDRNTRFFHSKASARAKINEICSLRDDFGNWVSDSEELGQIVKDYFGSIFKSTNPAVEDIEDVIETIEIESRQVYQSGATSCVHSR